MGSELEAALCCPLTKELFDDRAFYATVTYLEIYVAPTRRASLTARALLIARTRATAHVPMLTLSHPAAVLLSDGYSYERRAISLWLTCSNLSPVTNTPLASREMQSNVTLARVAKVPFPSSIRSIFGYFKSLASE